MQPLAYPELQFRVSATEATVFLAPQGQGSGSGGCHGDASEDILAGDTNPAKSPNQSDDRGLSDL